MSSNHTLAQIDASIQEDDVVDVLLKSLQNLEEYHNVVILMEYMKSRTKASEDESEDFKAQRLPWWKFDDYFDFIKSPSRSCFHANQNNGHYGLSWSYCKKIRHATNWEIQGHNQEAVLTAARSQHQHECFKLFQRVP